VAQASIALAIDRAFVAAGIPRGPAVAACFGLAGAGRESEQKRIAEWAKSFGVAHIVRVVGDAEPILAAASPDGCGIALICGTGSLAWGRNQRGEVARSGGWGYLLGDEGSGYAIARAGLIAALRAADGRGEPTAILSRILAELKAASPDTLVERVYSSEMTRERLAGLAKIVFDAAHDDAVAQSIIATAAGDLAEMIGALAGRLHFSSGEYALALTGSVILNQPVLRQQLLAQLAERGCPPKAESLVPDPVRGAIRLARSIMPLTTNP
jgi:N-acetylglucosamine kinase-like BadF-type ATPase